MGLCASFDLVAERRGFSIGHNPALYVHYTIDLPVGVVEAESPRFTPDDWWFRTVAVGIARDLPGVDFDGCAAEGVVVCLKALKPQDGALIDKAVEIVTAAGSQSRFLLKVRDSARQVAEIPTTIGAGCEPSLPPSTESVISVTSSSKLVPT